MRLAPFVLGFLLALDVFSKMWALQDLPSLKMWMGYPFGGVGLFYFKGLSASLNFVTNKGAAWGLFPQFSTLLLIFRMLIVFFMTFFVRKSFAIWLIIVGALGNIIDSFVYGHVIDFIYLNFWGYSFPVFNVADSCITIGTFLLIFSKKKKPIQVV